MRLFGTVDKNQTIKKQAEITNSEYVKWNQKVSALKIEYADILKKKTEVTNGFKSLKDDLIGEYELKKRELAREVKALEDKRNLALEPINAELAELERIRQENQAGVDKLKADVKLLDKLTVEAKEVKDQTLLDARLAKESLDYATKLNDDLQKDWDTLREEAKNNAKVSKELEKQREALIIHMASFAKEVNIKEGVLISERAWIENEKKLIKVSRLEVTEDRKKLKKAIDIWRKQRGTKTE